MLSNIRYVYGLDKDGNKVLLGAKVSRLDGTRVSKQEIYVGMHLSKEDILDNEVNAHALGITNLGLFSRRYDAVSASGIIYFPQTDNYSFLEEGDIVVPWKSNETVKETLDDSLEPYRAVVSDELKNRFKAMIEDLEPDDPMVELYDLTLSRHQTSSR